MRYRVTHITTYRYDQLVTLCHNELRLTPADSERQKVGLSEVVINPKPDALSSRLDFFGNNVMHFSIEKPHMELEVTVTSELEVFPLPSTDPSLSLPWNLSSRLLAESGKPEDIDARQYLYPSHLIEPSKMLLEYAQPSFSNGRPILEAVEELMNRIHKDFAYTSGATTVATPLEEVMHTRQGVCQDFAQIAVGCLRSMGLPARYISGYLETLPPPGKERLIGADASHAWFSVYVPDSGWHDFDPTNDMRPSERYVTIGHGRDFSDISPLKGYMVGGSGQKLLVSVDVCPLN